MEKRQKNQRFFSYNFLKKNRKGLQMSFGWLFGIIVGAFILFLAIYFLVKFIDTEQDIQDIKGAKEIGILLNPLETGFESSSSTMITMPAETRIYARCNEFGNFGKQKIQLSQKSLGKWSETNLNASFENKYIFSESIAEGKNFYVFSKPFKFPFKVSDLIYLTSTNRKYCFVNAPREIENELNNTVQTNFIFDDCGEQDVQVCFSSGNCDIEVNYNAGFVEKRGERMFFESDALMYAAIFSDSSQYECQLKRLMKRLSILATLYNGKAIFISDKCSSDLNLLGLSNSANSFGDSSNLGSVKSIADDIKDKNEFAMCKMW